MPAPPVPALAPPAPPALAPPVPALAPPVPVLAPPAPTAALASVRETARSAAGFASVCEAAGAASGCSQAGAAATLVAAAHLGIARHARFALARMPGPRATGGAGLARVRTSGFAGRVVGAACTGGETVNGVAAAAPLAGSLPELR
ncbi:MAG: hypothetical protein WDO74_31745 [Pseudomonadota bacterium]